MPAAELVQAVFAPFLQGLPEETAAQQFLVVPARGTPRWLLPARSCNVGSALKNWSPYRPASRMKWAAARAAYQAGCLPSLPGVASVNIHGAEDIDWRDLGWSGNEPPVPVIYVGTPGVNRKAVIHLVNAASGVCELIVKAPLTHAARMAIINEADVLALLTEEGYNDTPRLIHVDQERGITTQTAIHGRPGRRKFSRAHCLALQSLIHRGEYTTIVGHAMEWQKQLDNVFGGDPDGRIISAAMSKLDDTGPLPACWVHGDFAPWNIRCLRDGTLALLDWEAAQRSGLPLQDAFHFLHMQDYLFGARPTAHAGDVERLARAIGIPAEQRRKLEIAFLVNFYLLRRAAGEAAHCEYIMAALREVLHGKHQPLTASTRITVMPSVELAQKGTQSVSPSTRPELFAAVVAQLNSSDVPYCVLSGGENHADGSSSDVDFMFHPRDLGRIAPLLAQAALRTGGRLIQAIRHETSACYFILAKDDDGQTGYLDPDCASDYRWQGRLWLSAEKVLARRRKCKGMYLPAVPDEFAYYLIKKVLKQSAADFQLRRLRHLYQRDPVNCRGEMEKLWPAASVRALEKALAACDLARFRSAMPSLLAELKASAPAEGLNARVLERLRDGLRWVERVVRPTGMFVLGCGGGAQRQSTILRELLHRLAPAFRRGGYAELGSGETSIVANLRLARKLWPARICSTLVIASRAVDRTVTQRLAGFALRLLLQPHLMFVLVDDPEKTATSARRREKGNTGVVYLNSGLPNELIVQQASQAILQFLAARQERRLSLKDGPSASLDSSPIRPTVAEPAVFHLE